MAEAEGYVVQPGDTLWAISQRTGYSIQYLAAANGIANPDLIFPGQVIVYGGAGEDPVSWALGQVGKPYCWGGEGQSCYDCSGLVWASHARFGRGLPRTAAGQYQATQRVAEPQRGDLIFYGPSSEGPVLHVAISLGDGQMVHCTSMRTERCTVEPTWYVHIVGYGRVN